MNILPIDKIRAEAQAAAKTSRNVNDCCPYPFDTDAGRIYRLAFETACKLADDAVSDRAAADIRAHAKNIRSITAGEKQTDWAAA